MTSELLPQSVSFHLRPDSGVPAYLQLVQQIRQAVRMGVLDVGEQLPTVKEVVAELAINPNTVQKAYRELEHEGLVEGRQGVGTFVARRPEGPPPGTQARLARGLHKWVRIGPGRGHGRRGDGSAPARDPARHEGGRGRMMVVETSGLGKRFGQVWALQDCSLRVPRGRVTALLGPNGAGKTTLLRLLVGLAAPSAGSAEVLGRAPDGSEDFLATIGYLAQDVPLYRRLSADDHISLGGHLNPRWDGAGARERLARLQVPADRPVATLSGGQRAQVALGLALAKQPGLLLLDEPVAALDPLARREFLSALSEAVADGGLSVILSSHLVHDLERVCDHVILLSASRVQLCDDIDSVLATHRMLLGPKRPLSEVEPGLTVISATQTQRQTRLLVRTDGPVLDPSWDENEVGLEDVILAYMGSETAGVDTARRHLEVAP